VRSLLLRRLWPRVDPMSHACYPAFGAPADAMEQRPGLETFLMFSGLQLRVVAGRARRKGATPASPAE